MDLNVVGRCYYAEGQFLLVFQIRLGHVSKVVCHANLFSSGHTRGAAARDTALTQADALGNK
jgi:hypothetical protein